MGVVSLGLLLAACKKEGGSAAIDAILPKGTAAKLSPDLLAFAEELPGDIEGFGYFDAGKSYDELTKSGLGAEYRQVFEDMTAMAKRRWGVDASNVTGVGVVVQQRKPVFAFVAPARDPKPGEDAGSVLVAKLGRLTVVGESGSVLGLLASARQGKRLYQSKPAWLRAALTHAAGNFLFMSGSAEALLATAPDRVRAQFGDILDGTITVGRAGLGGYLSCKPGKSEAVKGMIEAGLGMAKGQVAVLEQELARRSPGPIAGVLLHHYSQAFFKSLEQKVSGDEVALTLGWHLPVLPKQESAPLAERVVAPGELGFVQVNLGAPLLQTLIAVTDVWSTPLDQATLREELSAELAKLLGTPGVDPRAITLSASPTGLSVASLHNAAVGQPGASLPVPNEVFSAVATKWGFALSMPEQSDALAAAVASPAPGLPSDIAIFADDKAAPLRAFVDLSKLPMKLPVPILAMMRTAALSIGEQQSFAEITTGKGQSKEFAAELTKLIAKAAPVDESVYADRANLSALLEMAVIMQRQQQRQLEKMLRPEVVADDRVRLSYKYDYSGNMRLVVVAGAVGITAAVALPAFMKYQARMQQLRDPGADLDLLPSAADDAADEAN